MISLQDMKESDVLDFRLAQDHRFFSMEVLTLTGEKFRLWASNEDGSPMDVTIGELHIVSNRVNRDLVPSLGELESIGLHQDLLILEGDFGDISIGATKIDIERVLPFSAKSKHAHTLSNMRKLLTVHDCIDVRGRGMVLVGLAEDVGAALREKDTFTLITKSGDMYPATAIAVEQFNMHRSHVVQTGILVGEQLAHLDWLIDSEIWIDSSS